MILKEGRRDRRDDDDKSSEDREATRWASTDKRYAKVKLDTKAITEVKSQQSDVTLAYEDE